mmetsp:Transcript_26416/g.37239  ORF Transcript_26416/g.37239 Transcript_26416/m.37239 type:complete len:152 (+) Transcript_26416:102-557(+)
MNSYSQNMNVFSSPGQSQVRRSRRTLESHDQGSPFHLALPGQLDQPRDDETRNSQWILKPRISNSFGNFESSTGLYQEPLTPSNGVLVRTPPRCSIAPRSLDIEFLAYEDTNNNDENVPPTFHYSMAGESSPPLSSVLTPRTNLPPLNLDV